MLDSCDLRAIIEAIKPLFDEALDGDEVEQIKKALNKFYANN